MKLRVQSYNFSTGNMIKYQTVKRKYQYATHIHQFTELIIPLKGTLSITTNDTTESLTVGQVAFVLPFQPHSYNSNEYNELAIFVFSSAFIPVFNEYLEKDFYENKRVHSSIFKMPHLYARNMLYL